MASPTLFTVGHGARAVGELIAVLSAAGVRRLVDVRRYPGSRHSPQFGRDALAASLSAAGIGYDWRGGALGGRRRASAASRHVALRNEAFRGYADHMDSEAFQAALEALLRDAAAGPPLAILCAETLWWRCHRRLIADALAARGAEVVHLLDADHRQAHPANPDARIDERGRPVYDVGESVELPGIAARAGRERR